MASHLMPGYQVMSDLLTIREKNVLNSLIQPHCTLIKTTVAQVLVAKEMGDGHLGWACAACGVLCIIKDDSVDSYFLRLYCVKRAELLWEQELYIPFKYTASRTYFHTFPKYEQLISQGYFGAKHLVQGTYRNLDTVVQKQVHVRVNCARLSLELVLASLSVALL